MSTHYETAGSGWLDPWALNPPLPRVGKDCAAVRERKAGGWTGGLFVLLGRLDWRLLNGRLAGFLHHTGDGFQDGGKIGLGTLG